MQKRWPLLGCAVLLTTVLGAQETAKPAFEISPQARKLHAKSLVLDTHADTTQTLLTDAAYDFAARHATGHVDIPRMREGGLDAVFFSIYISATVTGPEAVKRSLRLIDAVRETVRKYPNDLMLATTAAGVRRAHREKKIAALMGMEGGHMIDDDLRALRMYAELGVRYLTLTHGRNTNWADSSTDTVNPNQHNGLTEFGKDVVRELNRQGIMVDVSHVADKTFWDALAVSRAPLIASHSSCFALCNHPRNMKDEMIKAMAARGGVIQITYVNSFLSQELRNADEAIRLEREARLAEIDKQYAGDDTKRREERRRVTQEYSARLPKVSWEKIIEHIDHAVKLAGVDHVGLGSDFDGATMPEGMNDASYLPRITDALLKKGYSESDVSKILGGNLLRVLEQVEKVSKELQAAGK